MKALLLILAFTVLNLKAASAQEHEHKHANEQKHKISAASVKPLSQGKKLKGDAHLKSGMNKILAAAKSLQQTEGSGAITSEAVAQKIETEVADIFKNCKLDPVADAAIHPILASILEGATLLKKAKRLTIC